MSGRIDLKSVRLKTALKYSNKLLFYLFFQKQAPFSVPSEVKGAAGLLALSSVMCWDIKRADNAVRLHIKSSDTVKRRIARPAKNRYGVYEGKMQY